MEKKELFQIGEVAQLFRVSVSTLRHYESIGLLEPEYVDESSGYCYYSYRQFECLNTIRYLRVLGLSLNEISDFLNHRDVQKIHSLLQKQQEEVIRKKKELEIVEKKIHNRLLQLEDALSSTLDTIIIQETGPYKAAWIENDLSLHSYLDLETSIRKLDHSAHSALCFLGKVGVGIAQERLMKEQYDRYDLVFLLLDEEDEYEGAADIWKKQKCITIRFCGSHQDASVYYKKLQSYMTENHLVIDGFSREITMIDEGFTKDADRFVTEIQIPIREETCRRI